MCCCSCRRWMASLALSLSLRWLLFYFLGTRYYNYFIILYIHIGRTYPYRLTFTRSLCDRPSRQLGFSNLMVMVHGIVTITIVSWCYMVVIFPGGTLGSRIRFVAAFGYIGIGGDDGVVVDVSFCITTPLFWYTYKKYPTSSIGFDSLTIL